MLKILANDGMDKAAVEHLESLGHKVSLDTYSVDELKTKLKEFDCIVVRSATKIRKELIDEVVGSNLKLIVRAGVGVDNIDVDYAEEKGIKVRNTPNASSASVAELAIGSMFTLARFIGISNVTMRKGEWNKKHYKGSEIQGKKLGLIGYGRIAKETAKRAKALGMEVSFYNRSKSADDEYASYKEFNDIIKESDYISLHIPFDKKVGATIKKEQFDMMKDGVFLVNCARGGVVNEKDLLNALNEGKVAGVAIDVFEEEPTKNLELINHPHVSVTPHIGASTKEAQQRIGVETYEVILRELK